VNLAPVKSQNRIHHRKAFIGPVKYLDHYVAVSNVMSADISKGGLSILVSEPKDKGTPCVVAFDIRLANTLKRVNAWAKVVYCLRREDSAFRIGLRFVDCDSQSKELIEAFVHDATFLK
jgi:c-di-GMP-binding flagellar brake protein YcgR